MASPRGFEPPVNSLGSYFASNKINDILITCHIFATSLQISTLSGIRMTQSRAMVFEYGKQQSRVTAIIQGAMRRLCSGFQTFPPSPLNGKVRPRPWKNASAEDGGSTSIVQVI